MKRSISCEHCIPLECFQRNHVLLCCSYLIVSKNMFRKFSPNGAFCQSHSHTIIQLSLFTWPQNYNIIDSTINSNMSYLSVAHNYYTNYVYNFKTLSQPPIHQGLVYLNIHYMYFRHNHTACRNNSIYYCNSYIATSSYGVNFNYFHHLWLKLHMTLALQVDMFQLLRAPSISQQMTLSLHTCHHLL